MHFFWPLHLLEADNIGSTELPRSQCKKSKDMSFKFPTVHKINAVQSFMHRRVLCESEVESFLFTEF